MAMQTLVNPENYFKDLIRLQLKKPKRWNWELTTSKSSPNINLPVIQLFDSKGKLLVETENCKTNERRSWHSAQFPTIIENQETNDEDKTRNPLPTVNRKIRKSNSDLKIDNENKKSGRYIFRTCSAGTLLIREDTVGSTSHSRRSRKEGSKAKYVSPSSSDTDDKELVKYKERSNRKRRKIYRKATTHNLILPSKNYQENSKELVSTPCQSFSNASSTLAKTKDEKMGANVSRHSSKGLSGRRSQSSGSIGKSHKNNENATCGSLPSYLEDHLYNNKNEFDSLSVNNVDRIPPLDGAPLHWKFSDNQTVLCDQGYGSERSPEEEYPPPLPEHDNQCHHHLDIHSCYPFITPESTFCVTLAKGSRGLGLSVTGGIDSGGSWPGLIRVKRLFPNQPAAACGVLNVGDLILEANGMPLTGLTNYEALEVLRTAPNQVELRMCRPPPDVLNCVSPISEVPPPPPRREPPSTLAGLSPGNCSDDEYNGQFEITMRKMQGSLGFTLRKEDDSALGHYIRALVREPALNDGRIKPGDKIIAVNDVDISSMTHEEAVQYLRKSGDLVKLKLYRDAAQTPVSTLSPTEMTPRASFSKKPQLRQEAMDMLNDLAARKLMPLNQDSHRHSHASTSSPLRMSGRDKCTSEVSQDCTDYSLSEEQFHEGLLQRGANLPLDEESFNSLFIHEDDDLDRPSRPSSLELYNPNQTPVACRKPKFNFTLAHNAYELNNLDAEVLDAPNLTYNVNDDVNSTEVECGDSFSNEPTSMPHIPTNNQGFKHKNPVYQSAHPLCGLDNNNLNEERKTLNGNVIKNKLEDEIEKKPRRKKSIKEKPVPEEPRILAIELTRGWNSRLGFSLQGPVGRTFVSAVHADSVAAKDGRIRTGDRILKVNDESVENMATSEIIDLLRIVRGPVCIVVLRDKSYKIITN